MSTLTADAAMLAQDVSHFIPHRAPMILIDKLLGHTPDSLTTETYISSNSAYFDCQLNGVPNYVAIEYMAQSIAALAGIEALLHHEDIRVGFLLGSRKLHMHIDTFILGQSYRTQVTRLYQEESGLAVFDCHIYHQHTLVAQANVNVFQPKDTQAYIDESQTTAKHDQ
ncbi:thioester dehydrase [Shewanella livingstonensis]|uniref:Thioester dehydrase n=1 Tax=Shewanella livingstonensis TaxID=150120 RepID=A0A3G8LZW4_9GAMM|nr:thioester dehydrase [Shewanella livingstonensis]AZG74974.1 thioester dehydrase [Shewanella livingstonensis]